MSGSPIASPGPSSSRRSSVSSKASAVTSTKDRCATPHGVAFVSVFAGNSSTLNEATRRAVRVQAARASAQARRETIARKQGKPTRRRTGHASVDESTSSNETFVKRRPRSRSISSLGNDSRPPSPTEQSWDDGPRRKNSVGGQLEPFPVYPVSRWHPQIQTLVTYFLENFTTATPSLSTLPICSRGRAGMQELWAEAVKEPALFNALLLIAASHATCSQAIAVASSLLAQLSETAIQTINNAIARAESEADVGDSRLAAIALLAGWELEYGDPDHYDTHMRGLESIISMRGGYFSCQRSGQIRKPLSAAIVDMISSVGHGMAMFASKRDYLGAHGDCLPSPVDEFPCTLPAGFESLCEQNLLPPCLMRLVSRLATIDPSDLAAPARIVETWASLGEWDAAVIQTAAFSPLHTSMEERIRAQAMSFVRLAGMALCAVHQSLLSADDLHPHHQQQRLLLLHREATTLHPDLLVGTVYEELGFWALFTLCAATGQCLPPQVALLRMFTDGLDLTTSWPACQSVLSRYVSAAHLLGDRPYHLWDTLRYGGQSGIGREFLPRLGPTRFLKGNHISSRQIAATIIAEAEP